MKHILILGDPGVGTEELLKALSGIQGAGEMQFVMNAEDIDSILKSNEPPPEKTLNDLIENIQKDAEDMLCKQPIEFFDEKRLNRNSRRGQKHSRRKNNFNHYNQ